MTLHRACCCRPRLSCPPALDLTLAGFDGSFPLGTCCVRRARRPTAIYNLLVDHSDVREILRLDGVWSVPWVSGATWCNYGGSLGSFDVAGEFPPIVYGVWYPHNEYSCGGGSLTLHNITPIRAGVVIEAQTRQILGIQLWVELHFVPAGSSPTLIRTWPLVYFVYNHVATEYFVGDTVPYSTCFGPVAITVNLP